MWSTLLSMQIVFYLEFSGLLTVFREPEAERIVINWYFRKFMMIEFAICPDWYSNVW